MLFVVVLIGLFCVVIEAREGKNFTPNKWTKYNQWRGCTSTPQGNFLEAKWRRFIAFLDYDHDGKVSKKDHDLMGARYSSECPCGDGLKTNITIWFNGIWPAVYDVANTGRIEVTPDQVVEIYTQMGYTTMFAIATNVAQTLFGAVVGDEATGLMNVDLLYNYFNRFTQKSNAELTWVPDVITTSDKDNDGKLNIDEFTDPWVHFFVDVDQSLPSKNFWGPFPSQ